MKKLILFFLLLVGEICVTNAQNDNISQLYYAPGYLNPSLLGLSSRCFSARAFTKNQYFGQTQHFRNMNYYGSTFLNSIQHGFSINYLIQNEQTNIQRIRNSISFGFGGRKELNQKTDLAYGLQFSNIRNHLPIQPSIGHFQQKDLTVGTSVSWGALINGNTKIPKHLAGISASKTIQTSGLTGNSPMSFLIHGQTIVTPNKSILEKKLIFTLEGWHFQQGNQFNQQFGFKVNKSGWGFAGIYYQKNTIGNNILNSLVINLNFTLSNKYSSIPKEESGIFAQLSAPSNNIFHSSQNPNYLNFEAGWYFNSSNCNNCFQKPINYDKSFLAKTQKFWRSVFIGNGFHSRKTNTSLDASFFY